MSPSHSTWISHGAPQSRQSRAQSPCWFSIKTVFGFFFHPHFPINLLLVSKFLSAPPLVRPRSGPRDSQARSRIYFQMFSAGTPKGTHGGRGWGGPEASGKVENLFLYKCNFILLYAWMWWEGGAWCGTAAVLGALLRALFSSPSCPPPPFPALLLCSGPARGLC